MQGKVWSNILQKSEKPSSWWRFSREMAATGDLRSLLGPATFNQIPSHAAGVLQELWTKTSDNLRMKEEKVHECLVCTVVMLGKMDKNPMEKGRSVPRSAMICIPGPMVLCPEFLLWSGSC